MSSYADMSLDDIIQNKKREKPRRSKVPIKQQAKKPTKKLAVTDARNKIISKKRIQISDARDKLAELAKQKDARLKLEQLRVDRVRMARSRVQERNNIFVSRGKFLRTVPNKETVFMDLSRQVVYQPVIGAKNSARRQMNTKRFIESRSVETRVLDKMPRPKPILRTVENDIEIIDDPMGEEEYVPPKPSLNRKASLQLKIIAHNNDVRESRTSSVHRTEKGKSPPRPPSILKKRPMAALRSEKTEKPIMEYRIIVSNLRNTVTGGDIQELFGDVGGMIESRLVRPGTAEVIYKSQEDAQKAVDLYHNRQLDGQPMNCLLVTPRSPTAQPRSGNKPALYSTNSNVEPDISTFHKVLFSNL